MTVRNVKSYRALSQVIKDLAKASELWHTAHRELERLSIPKEQRKIHGQIEGALPAMNARQARLAASKARHAAPAVPTVPTVSAEPVQPVIEPGGLALPSPAVEPPNEEPPKT